MCIFQNSFWHLFNYKRFTSFWRTNFVKHLIRYFVLNGLSQIDIRYVFWRTIWWTRATLSSSSKYGHLQTETRVGLKIHKAPSISFGGFHKCFEEWDHLLDIWNHFVLLRVFSLAFGNELIQFVKYYKKKHSCLNLLYSSWWSPRISNRFLNHATFPNSRYSHSSQT